MIFENKHNSFQGKSQKEKILELTEEVFHISSTNCPVSVQRSKSNVEKTSPLRSFIYSKDYEKKQKKDEAWKLDVECCSHNETSQDAVVNSNDSLKASSNLDSNLPDWYQKRFFYNKSVEWKEYSNNLVDTHCHFEMLFYRFVIFFKLYYNFITSD